MNPPEQELQYHIFIVRCWKERSTQHSCGGPWRFSLEDPRTNTRHGFTSFAALAEFLNRSIEPPAEQLSAAERPASPPDAPTAPADHTPSQE